MTESNKKHPATRRYPPELRERAVRMMHETIPAEDGQSFGVIARLARQLGVETESLYSWVRQAEIDDGHRPGVPTTEAERMEGSRA